jgi:hypothetical protein
MRNVFILLGSFCFINFSFGQADSIPVRIKKNSIRLDLGVIHNRLIDEGYTSRRLLFYGTNLKLALGYGRETDNYIFNFSAESGSGKVESKGSGLPSEFSTVSLETGYLRKLKHHNLFGMDNLLFAGVQLSANNYDLENQPVFDNVDILFLNGIYLGVLNQIKIGKSQQLRVSYFLPVVLSTHRIIFSETNFTYEDEKKPLKLFFENRSTSYFSILKLFQLRVDYEKKLSRHASFTTRYRFFYANSSFRAPFQMYSNELLLGLKVNF